MPPKWPNARDDVREPIQLGGRVFSWTPSPQSSGSKRPWSGSTPESPGTAPRHLVARLVGDEARREQLPADREHIRERRVHAGARIAGRVESDAERVADSRAHVLGERHLGVLGDMSGEHAERLVRVDAPVTRTGDRLAPLEREPGRVRE